MNAEIDQTVRKAVSYFGRHRIYNVNSDDLHQQARLIALKTLKAQPEKAKNGGYLFNAIRRSLGNYISTEISLVSIHGNWEAGRQFNSSCAAVSGLDSHVPRQLHAGAEQEETAIERETDKLQARWRIDFRRALDKALRGLSDEDAYIVERKFGLDGLPESTDRALAAELGIPVGKIYRTWEKALRRLRNSLEMRLLDKHLDEMR